MLSALGVAPTVPTLGTSRLTVGPPEHVERGAAVGVRGQDIPQQPHLHRRWVRREPRSWGLRGPREGRQ